MKSLLEELPALVAIGKRQAAQLLESIQDRSRVTLQTRELVIPGKDTVAAELFRSAHQENEPAPSPNRLIYGDNLLTMAALLAGDDELASLRGRVDLIYIDPPFDSKADYRTKITLPGTTIDQKPTVLEQFAYSDTWAEGTASYLASIVPRLILMRELLSDTGVIYIHLDWHVGHYVKIVADEIFGRDGFRNEIVWQRVAAKGGQMNRLPSNHDTILLYGKSPNSRWYEQRSAYDFDELDEKTLSKYMYLDEDGRRFRLGPLLHPEQGRRANLEYELMGVTRTWRWTRERMASAVEAGRIVQTAPGNVPQQKMYLDEQPGRLVGDVWTDINVINSQATERLGYPTQKPEALLERIIQSATSEGDLVADFYAGSGTTAAVAERLNRNWIASDLGKPAAMMIRKRLIDQNAGPFVYQAIGDYQVEQARSTLGRRFRVGELAQVVLNLYGAVPLPPEENVNGSLGRLPGTKTLVYVDSPAKLTTISTLRRAQGYRDAKLGGFDKVTVLGWNFSAGIGQDIAGLNDPKLEMLVIPPDLLDRLKKKGADKLAAEVRFSSLQYLNVASVERKVEGDSEVLRVRLGNYVLLSPDAINLDDDNRLKLLEVMNQEPLALIEYWAIDPDYDGEVFRSVWQDYRGNTDNDDDELRVVTEATFSPPHRAGPRTICVRAVDVFGFESEVVLQDVEVIA